MTVKRKELEQYLNKLLNIYEFSDYCPNGLQVEGKSSISNIAYAVSATYDSIQKAIALDADALVVHHGLFWKFHGTRPIKGAFGKRVRPLIQNEMNLFGYHLPLDANGDVGNAVSLGKLLGMTEFKPFGDYKGSPTGVSGKISKIKASELAKKLESVLGHAVIHSNPEDNNIKSIGIITGGANSDWILAQRAGLDAYITGEISEHDWHEAKESNMHFFAGGHNATEKFGIQSLMDDLKKQFPNCDHHYIPSDNPA